MVRKKYKWPEEGELVIATVTRVANFGAFVELDEYERKSGLIHISEVSSGWVKNIRDHVREGQKVVAQVLNVDPSKGHIDLSLKRITERQRQEKIQEWKREQKAEKLLEYVANLLGKDLETGYREVGYPLMNEYDDLYTALEEIAISGYDAFLNLKISKDWKDNLVKIARENIEPPHVKISGTLKLSSPRPRGIDDIKEALIHARDKYNDEEVNVDIYYVGAPKYKIVITAPDYKIAENSLSSVAKEAINIIESLGGKGEFLREKD
ncbi:MAG: translation initiation factor IF-2 subunit alpha [Candidatus Hydrothermarchaeota archaeon]